jgi:dsRNA-specific ribonuclease
MSKIVVSKNDVQEYLMKRGLQVPKYETIGHGPFYSTVTVYIPGYPVFTATSLACLNKKAAELEAANRLWNTPEFLDFRSGEALPPFSNAPQSFGQSSIPSLDVPRNFDQLSSHQISPVSSVTMSAFAAAPSWSPVPSLPFSKNTLQEFLAKKQLNAPIYTSRNAGVLFTCEVVVCNILGYPDFTATSAECSTKKAAELEAAHRLWNLPAFEAFRLGGEIQADVYATTPPRSFAPPSMTSTVHPACAVAMSTPMVSPVSSTTSSAATMLAPPESSHAQPLPLTHSKTTLQECLAKKQLKPIYSTTNVSPFVSVVTVSIPGYSDFAATSVESSTKKAAEKDAAHRLLSSPEFAAFIFCEGLQPAFAACQAPALVQQAATAQTKVAGPISESKPVSVHASLSALDSGPVSVPLPVQDTGLVSMPVPLPVQDTGLVSMQVPLPVQDTGLVSVSVPLPVPDTGLVSMPVPLPVQDSGYVFMPTPLHVPDTGLVSMQVPLPAPNSGIVSMPVPLPVQDSGLVSIPVPLPAQDTGIVSMPVPLPAQDTGIVSMPEPLPAQDTGLVSMPVPLPVPDSGLVLMSELLSVPVTDSLPVSVSLPGPHILRSEEIPLSAVSLTNLQVMPTVALLPEALPPPVTKSSVDFSFTKNTLQDCLAKKRLSNPRYSTTDVSPFVSVVTVSIPGYPDFTATSAECSTKKAAELEAARRLWNSQEFIAFKSGELLSHGGLVLFVILFMLSSSALMRRFV